jgi:hypothetical protein
VNLLVQFVAWLRWAFLKRSRPIWHIGPIALCDRRTSPQISTAVLVTRLQAALQSLTDAKADERVIKCVHSIVVTDSSTHIHYLFRLLEAPLERHASDYFSLACCILFYSAFGFHQLQALRKGPRVRPLDIHWAAFWAVDAYALRLSEPDLLRQYVRSLYAPPVAQHQQAA